MNPAGWRAATRAFVWRHPVWWAAALTAFSWCYLASSWLDKHAAHRFHITHWVAMVAAMMLPLMWGHLYLIAQRSLWDRRDRAIALFLAAYLMLWLLVGLIAIGVAGRNMDPPSAAVCLMVAAGWQLTPWKHAALVACHRTIPLAPSGWKADWDCLRYGWKVAGSCLVSCWALMLACVVNHESFWLMIGLAALLLKERAIIRPCHSRFAFAILIGALVSAAVHYF